MGYRNNWLHFSEDSKKPYKDFYYTERCEKPYTLKSIRLYDVINNFPVQIGYFDLPIDDNTLPIVLDYIRDKTIYSEKYSKIRVLHL